MAERCTRSNSRLTKTSNGRESIDLKFEKLLRDIPCRGAAGATLVKIASRKEAEGPSLHG